MLKNFIIQYDTVSNVDEGTDPIEIITGDDGIPFDRDWETCSFS